MCEAHIFRMKSAWKPADLKCCAFGDKSCIPHILLGNMILIWFVFYMLKISRIIIMSFEKLLLWVRMKITLWNSHGNLSRMCAPYNPCKMKIILNCTLCAKLFYFDSWWILLIWPYKRVCVWWWWWWCVCVCVCVCVCGGGGGGLFVLSRLCDVLRYHSQGLGSLFAYKV